MDKLRKLEKKIFQLKIKIQWIEQSKPWDYIPPGKGKNALDSDWTPETNWLMVSEKHKEKAIKKHKKAMDTIPELTLELARLQAKI